MSLDHKEEENSNELQNTFKLFAKRLLEFYEKVGLDPNRSLSDQIDEKKAEKLGIDLDDDFFDLTKEQIELIFIDKEQPKRKKKSSVSFSERGYLSRFNTKEFQTTLMNLDKIEDYVTSTNEPKMLLKKDNVTISIEEEIDPIKLFELRQKGNVNEVIKKLEEKVKYLDEDTIDTYKILNSHWLEQIFNEGHEEGKAFITFEEIHFNYRRKTGKNKHSTLTQQQKNKYVNIFKTLESCSVYIDISNENSKVYKKAKEAGVTKVESHLLRVNRTVDEDGEIIGIIYDFDNLGEIYTKLIKQFNNRYPIGAVRLDNRYYKPAKKIIDQVSYWHRSNKQRKSPFFEVKFITLLEMANYDISNKREKKKAIDRFIERQLSAVEQVLRDSDLIKKMEIPKNINSKNYNNESIKIKIHWNLDSY